MIDEILSYAPPPDLLAGRAILITGAGSGIGRAVSCAAAAHGARVTLLGRTQRKLEETYDMIVAAGHLQPAICPFDLAQTDWQAWLALADGVEKEYGKLDGLVHNAGLLGRLAPLEHFDAETWHKVVQVNLNAPFLLTRACLPLLQRCDDASVIFVSSSVGRKGRAYWGAYAASKFGVEGLMQTLADETESAGRIRANSLNPGGTRTAMRKTAYPSEDAAALAAPEDIVAPFLYLLGPDSRGINGRALNAQ